MAEDVGDPSNGEIADKLPPRLFDFRYFPISLIMDGHNFSPDDWKVDGIDVRPPRPHIPVRPQIHVQSAMQNPLSSSRKKTTAVRPRRKVAHNVQKDSSNEGSSSTSISNQDLSLLKGWNENVLSQSDDAEDVTMDDVDTQKDVDEVVHPSNDDQQDKEVDKSSTHLVYSEVIFACNLKLHSSSPILHVI
ncbi:unnamed protein product [Cochlearia groenlandica]